jgi:hypothetical protein
MQFLNPHIEFKNKLFNFEINLSKYRLKKSIYVYTNYLTEYMSIRVI